MLLPGESGGHHCLPDPSGQDLDLRVVNYCRDFGFSRRCKYTMFNGKPDQLVVEMVGFLNNANVMGIFLVIYIYTYVAKKKDTSKKENV